MTGTAMIVDGQNLLMRAIFAAKQSGMSSHGVITGPLVIFVNSLAKHVQIDQPERLLIVWDGGTSKLRRDRLPEYKANRKPVPDEDQTFRDSAGDLTRRLLTLFGVSQVLRRGYEADDLIAGAWASTTREHADQIVILSSDKDFLQLVGGNPWGIDTELVRLSSAGTPTDRWTEMRVVDDLGFSPPRWPLVTALAGDASDGVPGLPGIGPKKAVKLLTAAEWDWPTLMATLTPEQADLATRCLEVVDLRHIQLPAGVPPWRPTAPGSALWTPLIEFLSAYELRSVKDRLVAGVMWSNRDLISATESDVSSNGRA